MTKENLDQETFETVEAYIIGDMTQEETAEFESRLALDAQLRSELEIMRESILAVELGAFESSISDIAENYDRNNPSIGKKPRTGWKFISLAAAIAALISLFFIFDIATPSNEKLYAEYFKEDPGLPVAMGANSSYDFSDAMVDYKAEKYELAIAKWTTLLADDPQNDTLNYFIANSLMNSDQIEKAIPMFQQVAKNSESRFKDKAQWYLALAFVHQNDREALSKLDSDQNDQFGERIEALKTAYHKL